ncbi:YbfA family protein [Plesiomonas shigelloides]|uniref:Uncharacterized protein n=2 Tax=Plesiomonas shigelloides TaxID=703 RepID=R8ANH5_PLESH|nr:MULTISPECIES: YbfA family protein [Plesiomonas]MCX9457899.1 YbfA family protein [Vibrio cholerae]MDO4687637.1 YbfA family protein [Plesiomonas sp.]AVQ88511.1 DUF2517 domain-containing protein [Plesiomonas shigelloides]EON87876.1 hypothetical protein PLESHI_13178 [Plesiomonas shigelloides 302-73]KAB7661232.1 DUF2517 family protein [Plesiomonas shigelloides]
MYQKYSLAQILLRRTGVLIAGSLALPVMVFHPNRARFYSYLHRVWSKTSSKPVWLASSERSVRDFY